MPSKRRIVLLIELIFINLLNRLRERIRSEGGGDGDTTTTSNSTGNTSANATTRGSLTELKEIDEKPESEDDDFDTEASPRQIAKNRLKVGFSKLK